MPRGNAVVAVDLGTSKVCTIVAEALADGRTSILGVGLCPAKGMAKGVVVDLGSDIEGFVPMSQLGIPDIQQPGDAVKEGQAVELKVLEVDPIHHRIVLAATGFPKDDIIPPPPAPAPVTEETPNVDA